MWKELWIFSLSSALLTVCFNTARAGEAPANLIVPYSAIGGASTPIWVPKEAGIFSKYGLTVDLVYIATSTRIMQATLAGGVDLSFSG